MQLEIVEEIVRCHRKPSKNRKMCELEIGKRVSKLKKSAKHWYHENKTDENKTVENNNLNKNKPI